MQDIVRLYNTIMTEIKNFGDDYVQVSSKELRQNTYTRQYDDVMKELMSIYEEYVEISLKEYEVEDYVAIEVKY